MIKGTFRMAADVVEVIVKGNELLFCDSSTGMISTIEGIRLSKVGVVKEHPDLEDNEYWKKIAIDRLKEHMQEFNTEGDKLNYVKNELIKFGYDALYKQKGGHRPQKF